MRTGPGPAGREGEMLGKMEEQALLGTGCNPPSLCSAVTQWRLGRELAGLVGSPGPLGSKTVWLVISLACSLAVSPHRPHVAVLQKCQRPSWYTRRGLLDQILAPDRV